MQELGPAFERSHTPTRVTFNFGGSGTLEQQIEHGAPVDVFLSAAAQQMDQLASRGLIRNDTRIDRLRNQIVLIAAPGNASLNSFGGLTSSGRGTEARNLRPPAIGRRRATDRLQKLLHRQRRRGQFPSSGRLELHPARFRPRRAGHNLRRNPRASRAHRGRKLAAQCLPLLAHTPR
jgi:hypothetical protein